jgi:hypothetical protein
MAERNMAKGSFRPLGKRSSQLLRRWYTEKLAQSGAYIPLQPTEPHRVRLRDGTLFAEEYTRVVVGDYGAYVEIHPDAMVGNLECPVKERWRLAPGLEHRAFRPLKYEWWVPKGRRNTKVYRQRGLVRYADYRVGYYYISPEEVVIEKNSIVEKSSIVEKRTNECY